MTMLLQWTHFFMVFLFAPLALGQRSNDFDYYEHLPEESFLRQGAMMYRDVRNDHGNSEEDGEESFETKELSVIHVTDEDRALWGDNYTTPLNKWDRRTYLEWLNNVTLFFPVYRPSCFNELLTVCECPLHIYIILEHLPKRDFRIWRQFDAATSFAHHYFTHPLTKTAVIEVDPKLQPPLKGIPEGGQLNIFKHGFATSLADALRYVSGDFFGDKPPKIKNVVIILSDGRMQEYDAAAAEVKQLKRQEDFVFGLLVGTRQNKSNLVNIMGEEEHVFGPYNDNELVLQTEQSMKVIRCTVCCWVPEGPHPVCPCPEFLIILVEVSEYMTDHIYHIRDFLRRFVPLFSFRGTPTLVSVFADTIQNIVGLGDIDISPVDLDEKLRKIPVLGGPIADVAGALKSAWDFFFGDYAVSTHGVFSELRKKVIVLTSGLFGAAKSATAEAARRLWGAYVDIIPIAIGDVPFNEVWRLAGYAGHVVMSSLYDQWSVNWEMIQITFKMTCNIITTELTYLPPPVPCVFEEEVCFWCMFPIDYVLAMDSNLPQNYFLQALRISNEILAHYSVFWDANDVIAPTHRGHQFSFVTFNAGISPVVMKQSTTERWMIHRWISRLHASPEGGAASNIANLVNRAAGQYLYPKRHYASKVLVVFTDGGANDAEVENIEVAREMAMQNGIHILAVPIGKQINREIINALATHPKNIMAYQTCKEEWLVEAGQCYVRSVDASDECVQQIVRAMCPSPCSPYSHGFEECRSVDRCDM